MLRVENNGALKSEETLIIFGNALHYVLMAKLVEFLM